MRSRAFSSFHRMAGFVRLGPLTTMCVVILAVMFGLMAVRWHHRSEPEYVLEVLDQARSREDVQHDGDYLTPQGRDVILWTMEKMGDEPMTNAKDVRGQPIISGNVCDIPVRTEKGAGTIRLLKTDHWRFHDFYVDKSQGKDIGLWVSYAKDHPYATAWTLLWK